MPNLVIIVKNLIKRYTFRRLKNMLFLFLAKFPMPGHDIRPLFVKWGGVDITTDRSFVGSNVTFDTVAPSRIHISAKTVITEGTLILTHYQNSITGKWSTGDVYIEENVFIGARTIITKPVRIGKNALIGLEV